MPPFLAALLRLPGADPRKLSRAAWGFAAALVLMGIALIYLVDALALGLLELMHPALASLTTAVIVLLFAVALFGIARLWLKVALATARKRPIGGLNAANVATMLTGLRKVVRTHKKEAALAAALAGVLASAVLGGSTSGQAKNNPGDRR